jgi:outer membrane protein TolC
VANARRDEGIAETRVAQARAQALPQVTLKAGYTRLDDVTSFAFDSQTLTMGRLDNYSASAEVSQLLYSGGLVRTALQAAQTYRDLTRAGTGLARASLVRDIRIAFHDALLARDAAAVMEQSVDQLRRFADQVADRRRNQTASEFDHLSARVQLANETPKLARARNACEVAREALRNVARIEEPAFELAGALAYVPVETNLAAWVASARARRPELRQMELRVRLLQADIESAESEYKPTVRAVAAGSGTDPAQFASVSGWDFQAYAGVTATWNLFEGGRTKAKVAEKRIEKKKAEADLEELERAVELEVRQAFGDMLSAREAVQGGEENVRLAEKALEIARTRFHAGLSTSLEFAESNLALNVARLSLCQSLRDHVNAAARLHYAAGRAEEPAPRAAGR